MTPALVTSGRTVVTHSTYLPGLLTALRNVALVPTSNTLADRGNRATKLIKTIVPGRIKRIRTRANTNRLAIKVTVPTRNGHKMLAKHGHSIQELFIVTKMSKEELQSHVDSHLTTADS